MLTCEPCQRMFVSQEAYSGHLRSKNHVKETDGAWLFCPVCDIYVLGLRPWKEHVGGAKHVKAHVAKGMPPDVQPQEPRTVPGHEYCTTCRMHVPQHIWARHPSTPRHLKKAQSARYRSALDEAEKDKLGVVIEGEGDFGVLSTTDGKKGQTKRLALRLTSPAQISVVDYVFSSHRGDVKHCSPSQFSVALAGKSRTLVSGERPLHLDVSFRQGFLGSYQDRLEIKFEDRKHGRQFVIVRNFEAVVGDQHDHDQFGARSVYVPRKVVEEREPETNVIPEPPMPAFEAATKYVVSLPKAAIPRHIEDILSQKSNGEVMRKFKQLLPKSLNTFSYAQYFKPLLWAEEYKMNRDLEFYDIPDATLKKSGKHYSLNVPGLAEKRPSVLKGDTLLVRRVDGPPGTWFSGRVNDIRETTVELSFHSSLQWTQSQRYVVRFKPNRTPWRRQHQALDRPFDEERATFPRTVDVPLSAPGADHRLPLKNALVRDNERQLQAVTSILRLPKGSLPFIIFGPPGTGKTVTIVEAILQILDKSTDTCVMACAPSNSAADIIATRLKEALPAGVTLFRHYAVSRSPAAVPESLRDCICTTEGGLFTCPPRAQVQKYRVVVSTCVSASVFAGVGVPRGHYSHIFVDEAGQATECEVAVPIRTIAGPDTNIILSGDPKQLGPIIRSGIAQQLGLEQSMIERLMKLDAYELPTRQGRSVVKLTKNFRSHISILKYPNERFYNNELTQCADPKIIKTYHGWPHLPNRNFPIIFHAISGQEAREASSPSFFNVHEITQVKEYVRLLKSTRGSFRTASEDIGVITPYHAQCLKIRKALAEDRDTGDMKEKVGSVEMFQGDERRVIIISTVRSSRDFIEYDLKHTLGFVANPRRFNGKYLLTGGFKTLVLITTDTILTVAVTRAKALLIIVGDPHVLQLDSLWRQFLNYVHDNGGWTGIPIPWDPNEPVDDANAYDQDVAQSAQAEMDRLMKALEVTTRGNVVVEDDETGANIDREWRDIE
ncbi:RNA helicase [Fistulina hepatica ATCC 64428]|uniref:RNA helicase n=1 Tax=Fistulina hepatica ATCC 64428 TaxID=1128425 RepID=A0A0D7A967_9AGAR|nr:RNA helicase [Fistulina hepatica ATCC 64428]